MPEVTKISQLGTLPGIKRDGTVVDGDQFSDGQWVRFQRGRPKKMGGYTVFAQSSQGIVRSIQVVPNGNKFRTTYGTSQGIFSLDLATDLSTSGTTTRTPSDYAPGDYLWQTDVMYDAAVGSSKALTFWHACNALSSINDSTASAVFYGDAYGATALTPIVGLGVSGGVCAATPHLVVYGSDGLVGWSNDNEPTNFTTGNAGFTRATALKIVKALPLKGAGYTPSLLLWSLDSVIRMYRTTGVEIFKFDPVTTESSILAQNSVIEYDGMFFWVGNDRFFVYAGGQVQELPNDMSQNWFFDNVNYAAAQKIWATKVTRYGEIWWFYPRGTATECTDAVIFNVRQKIWYDANLSRTAGTSVKSFTHPIWADGISDPDTGGYDVHVHETGYNKVKGGAASAIPSWFETCDFGYPTGGNVPQNQEEGLNRWTRVVRVEPDFLMNGTMTMDVVGREFPQGPDSITATVTFDSNAQRIDVRTQMRHPRLRFTSNILDGYYEMGRTLLHLEPGDVRS